MTKKHFIILLSAETLIVAAIVALYSVFSFKDVHVETVSTVMASVDTAPAAAKTEAKAPGEDLKIYSAARSLDGGDDTDADVNADTEPDINTPTPPPPVTIAFCGDILIDSGVKTNMYNSGQEAVFPIGHAYPLIEADIAMANLEFPLSLRGSKMPEKEFAFRGDPAHISFFTDTGVDIVSVANNHILDYGYDAFSDTLDLLDNSGIKYVGAGRNLDDAKRYSIFEVSGMKIAFLSASRVIPVVDWYANPQKPGVFGTYNPDDLYSQIAEAKRNADFVAVYTHWGIERKDTPEAYQIDMAKGYIENGADIVLGSHPHVLQGFEYHMGKPIVYSLGNFVFTDANKDTMVVTVTVSDGAQSEVKIIPYQITNRRTTLMEDEQRKLKLKEHLNSVSFGARIDDGWVLRASPEN